MKTNLLLVFGVECKVLLAGAALEAARRLIDMHLPTLRGIPSPGQGMGIIPPGGS
ncbi:MAG TPA: hypothetical protein VJ698_23870 [Noviherbaspirillum sp.]|uniref:hypothetical protein n=1 Tax=Noviherbaspirillum sp. TaxID=1926288 RepID=UPI002B4A78C0|nr:hypothetical protein [Noviherbaspirillum sp.]HJV76547.1 hypothetical protein [Noviherbaspirillum sp.]HJV88525.1 hypothetical protein [Noviherbaspirillum sp.]